MKKILGIVVIILIIALESYTIYKMREEYDIRIYEAKKLAVLQEKNSIYEEEEVKTKNEDVELQYLNLIPEKYKGYNVSAKLKIEKLNINTYVLEEYSKDAMQASQIKYFGPNPNEIRKLLYCWT